MHLNAFTSLQVLDPRYLDVLVVRLHKHCETLRFTVRTLALHYPTGGTKRIVSFVSFFSDLKNLTVAVLTKLTFMTLKSQQSNVHYLGG